MSRTSGSYTSLIRGVSEQVAHDRLEGQHWLQDNMISDPVRGLSRRHGSVFMDSLPITSLDSSAMADLTSRQESTFVLDGVEYAAFYSKGVSALGTPSLIFVDKGSRRFVPSVPTVQAAAMLRRGIASLCTAGKYLLLASSEYPTEHTVKDNKAASAKQHVVWVRGGAYSRQFTVTVTDLAGVKRDYTYTTMKSYYDQPLITSDIPHLDPDDPTKPNKDYQKLVNDRTNAYNSAVNKHIADAAKDITPENIAAKLVDLIKVDYPATVVHGAYIALDLVGVVTADDSGNGDFIRTVSNVITAPELATPKHFPGKVVRVQPAAAGSIPYYLQAVSTTGSTGFTEVSWREAAGEQITPGFMFFIGALHQGSIHIGTSPADLSAVLGYSVPVMEPSRSGDTVYRAVPEMFGKKITHMRMFQDRLMLVAGSTVFMSRSGDYFNLFPESMLTIKDDDPIEVFAQGSEDDTITAGVQHDRNLVLFGRRFQYVVPGRDSVTPRNAYVGIASTYEGANLTQPAAAGSLMFFCQRRERRLTMQQMQPGAVADRLEAFDVSAQLDGYLHGTPQQILALTSPSMVAIKTKELTNGFYVYSFLDSNDQSERMFDSWSRWTFSPNLGGLVGITTDDSGILAVTARGTPRGEALVLDRFTRETDMSDRPYLDSQQPYSVHSHGDYAYGVFDSRTTRAMLGAPIAGGELTTMAAKFPESADFIQVGTLYDSVVVLTSPYLRDRDDKIILDAKLTVTKAVVSLARTAALNASVSTDGGKNWTPALNWVSRQAGTWKLNTQDAPEQTTVTVPIMKDNKSYRLKLASRNWLPLTISVVEWSGQVFTSRR